VNGAIVSTDGEKCALCGACAQACYAQAREMVGREVTVAQVMAEIEQDVAFYDESGGGATFSGGEPLAQRDFLLALLRACKAKEIHTVVDTCGFATWETLDRVREHVDLFFYDLKLMDDARHKKFTGVSNELILRNLRTLSGLAHDIVLRVPIVPGVNDDAENLQQIGALAATLPHLKQVDVLPYHHIALDKYARLNKVYKLRDTCAPSQERMAEVTQILQGFGLQVQRGD
jgi:pyruvate formate lyase activating enzyme